jgi:hypothetical protein
MSLLQLDDFSMFFLLFYTKHSISNRNSFNVTCT